VKRTTGQHPGGIVVLPAGDEITNYTPVQRPADDPGSDFVTTHFDYHAIENCLVKLDILGHDDPTMIRLLTEMTGKDIWEIRLDDPAVLSLFQGPEALGLDKAAAGVETGTLGVPEFGTGFVRGMLMDTLPATFSDLLRISGFSHGTDVWLGNIRDILRQKLGTMKEVIGCRDDIMLTLIQAGLEPRHGFRIMERVRRGKGLAREDEQAMEEAGVPDWYIGSCQKIKYLFPKAHAVAYVTMAFRIAWFKIYEPLAFYAATFSVRGGLDGLIAGGGLPAVEKAMGEIQVRREHKEASARDEESYTSLELAREMLLRGLAFAPVSLERSAAGRYLIEDGRLRIPFMALPGLGLEAAQGIVRARAEKPYRSAEDLRRRGRLGEKLTEALRQYGALGDLPQSDQQSLF
jgi:DNA polymerase-3 subunit alpha (Gram-positive type)